MQTEKKSVAKKGGGEELDGKKDKKQWRKSEKRWLEKNHHHNVATIASVETDTSIQVGIGTLTIPIVQKHNCSLLDSNQQTGNGFIEWETQSDCFCCCLNLMLLSFACKLVPLVW
jgi:hypothetical protein